MRRRRPIPKIDRLATVTKKTEKTDPLAGFSEPTRAWFERSFEAPTPAQEQGWPAIATGENTLICAPTGSGKTLTAFLWGIDRLAKEKSGDAGASGSEPAEADAQRSIPTGVSLVYVSPLKALSYDVERNLRAPLAGIGADLRVALRTGDTPQRERQAMIRKPPDILITTPESLYLMLTSQARDILTDVEAVIVDEIHAVAPTKRGAHMALTLERLERHVAVNAGDGAGRERPIQRIGLSATQRPLERIASFLTGPGRECRIVDAGVSKEMDLEIVVPVADMADPTNTAASSASRPGATAADAAGADAVELPGPDPAAPGAVPGDSPSRGIWPAIYPELLSLVREHTSTIIFVNNRRGAERLAKRLNEMNAEEEEANRSTDAQAAGAAGMGDPAAGSAAVEPAASPPPDYIEEIARAHHGSLAREERLKVEELLKSGQLPCIVATSSLELGIDMGAVDLVIQVESPKSVARGMQRVGRAGHELGAVSKGRIFPKFRSDLLECAVVAKRMRTGEIEETVIPRNPLDVLAQQIVAMVADEEWEVDEIERVVKSAEPYGELSREQLENVLDMLDGRYPSERFAELRPRIVWDRTAGTVRGRKGARQLAVTNAGTIPDRGLFGVHLPDGRRVGELDEEMVYEARAGQVFLLGASSWRIEEITRDRVIVTPAPGVPGAVPFWRGEGIGRPVELGRAIGEFSREAVATEPEELAATYDLDQLAAENLVAYLREQQAATRVVPSDETIVVERFRDEIGDWRLCVLSPFGGRVHAAWGLALAAKIRAEHELEADAIWSDDGIVIHLPDSDQAPASELVLLEPDEVEDLIVGELSGSALFGARFREAAGRSLLIPRAYPGKRTPLWQQRLKSQSLLEVAKDFPRFPVTLETYREVLRDVLDLPALGEILRDLQSRRLSLVEVETKSASPFASSLLFDYVATYMYEGDTPNAERRAAALALDRDLLRELLGQEELRELIDPAALADVEDSLQHRLEQARAIDRDQLQVILRRLGDLSDDEVAERVAEGYSAQSMLSKLESERRAVKVRIAGEERWIAAEDGGLYRDALGVPVPSGLPDAFLETVAEPMETLLRRYARTHVPFPTAQPKRRFGVDPTPALKRLEAAGELVRGELLPGGSEREWCDPDVLRTAPPRQPRGPPQGGRGRRHVRARPLPRLLAERRRLPGSRGRPGPAPGDPRPPPGGRAYPGGLGAGRPSAPDRRLLADLARPALDRRRNRLDRRRPGRPDRARRLLLPRGREARRAAAREREARSARGRDPRRDPRAPRPPALVLARHRRRARRRSDDLGARGAAFGALGPRLGGRGDQRRGRSAPGAAPEGLRGRRRQARPPVQLASQRHRAGGRRPLVADRVAVPGGAAVGPAAAGAGGADARALRHRHPRDGPRRGRPGWLLGALRRAFQPRDARDRSPRLLRRGPRRRPVRARRRR